MNCNAKMGDKECMQDALTSQKFITGEYNTYVNEAATPEVKNTLLNILAEEHRMQGEVFTEMSNRGWYKTEPAEEQKLQQEKMKNSSFCESCKG